MENRVQELLEMLYSMITEAWGVPLGNDKCVIERDKALDLLDEIKAQLPGELAEAKRLVDARSEFIANAKREASEIRRTAEEQSRKLVDEQEVLKIAKTKSAEMLTKAESTSSELKRVTNEYVDDAMRRTEDALSAALDEIRGSRAKFRSLAGPPSDRGSISKSIDIEVDE